LAWGIFFKSPSWPGAVLAGLATALLTVTAITEERENLHYFGAEYQQYMRHTKRFIPYLF
jgi:protein-S-isoprenylcysteine O-methyltransferase Ste14